MSEFSYVSLYEYLSMSAQFRSKMSMSIPYRDPPIYVRARGEPGCSAAPHQARRLRITSTLIGSCHLGILSKLVDLRVLIARDVHVPRSTAIQINVFHFCTFLFQTYTTPKEVQSSFPFKPHIQEPLHTQKDIHSNIRNHG